MEHSGLFVSPLTLGTTHNSRPRHIDCSVRGVALVSVLYNKSASSDIVASTRQHVIILFLFLIVSRCVVKGL